MDTALRETRPMSEEICEGQLINIVRKVAMTKRMRMSQRKGCQQSPPIKELLERFHKVESTQDKMLEVDSTFKSSRTLCQSIKKMLVCILSYLTRRPALVKLLLTHFSQRNRLLVSDVLNYNVLNISFTVFFTSLHISDQQ